MGENELVSLPFSDRLKSSVQSEVTEVRGRQETPPTFCCYGRILKTGLFMNKFNWHTVLEAKTSGAWH